MPKPPAATPPSPRRRRWKIADARSVLALLATSGLSLHEFASREGLEVQRLRRWQRRLAREAKAERQSAKPAPAPKSPTAPALIELRPPRPTEPIEIVLGSGVTLRVAETIDGAALARLVTALRGC
jgi:transposase-like protein